MVDVIYGGIGSRKTPVHILDIFYMIGRHFAQRGSTLTSGHALGADIAFELGVDSVNGLKRIYTADDARNRPLWHQHASRYHPAWDRCNETARNLHARNSAIVLGPTLDKPVDCIPCYTPDGKASGGTGQALRIAADWKIPIFNFYHAVDIAAFWDWARDHG